MSFHIEVEKPKQILKNNKNGKRENLARPRIKRKESQGKRKCCQVGGKLKKGDANFGGKWVGGWGSFFGSRGSAHVCIHEWQIKLRKRRGNGSQNKERNQKTTMLQI